MEAGAIGGARLTGRSEAEARPPRRADGDASAPMTSKGLDRTSAQQTSILLKVVTVAAATSPSSRRDRDRSAFTLISLITQKRVRCTSCPAHARRETVQESPDHLHVPNGVLCHGENALVRTHGCSTIAQPLLAPRGPRGAAPERRSKGDTINGGEFNGTRGPRAPPAYSRARPRNRGAHPRGTTRVLTGTRPAVGRGGSHGQCARLDSKAGLQARRNKPVGHVADGASWPDAAGRSNDVLIFFQAGARFSSFRVFRRRQSPPVRKFLGRSRHRRRRPARRRRETRSRDISHRRGLASNATPERESRSALLRPGARRRRRVDVSTELFPAARIADSSEGHTESQSGSRAPVCAVR